MIEHLNEIAQNSQHVNWSYLLIFLFSLAENSLYLGFIVPGTILLIIAGGLAQQGTLSLPIVFLSTCSGTIIGDSISYWLAYFTSVKVLRKTKIQSFIQRYNSYFGPNIGRFVLLAHHSVYIRSLIPTIAGVLKINYSKWVMFDIVGALLSCSMFILIGWLGANVIQAKSYISMIGLAVVLFIIALGTVCFIVKQGTRTKEG